MVSPTTSRSPQHTAHNPAHPCLLHVCFVGTGVATFVRKGHTCAAEKEVLGGDLDSEGRSLPHSACSRRALTA
jgi:hypothetical protein